MKHSRKKRTPQLNLDKLKEVGSQIRAEGDLGALASYFLLLERMEQEGVLTAVSTPSCSILSRSKKYDASAPKSPSALICEPTSFSLSKFS